VGVGMMEYRALAKSELKQRILQSLLSGDKKLSDIKADIVSSETTILHALKDLEKMRLTKKSESTYGLSPLGTLEASITQGYLRAIDTLDKFSDFWLTHNVRPITNIAILNLGKLLESKIVCTESNELRKVHDNLIKIMNTSKKIRGLSPVFHADFFTSFKSILNNGGTIELILSNQVLNKTLEKAVSNEDSALFEKYLKNQQLQIYVQDDLKIALTITEDTLSMGLFYPNGQYDYNTDLISFHPQALQWGDELFQEYLKESKKINF